VRERCSDRPGPPEGGPGLSLHLSLTSTHSDSRTCSGRHGVELGLASLVGAGSAVGGSSVGGAAVGSGVLVALGAGVGVGVRPRVGAAVTVAEGVWVGKGVGAGVAWLFTRTRTLASCVLPWPSRAKTRTV